jgi:serine/threonine-protein kinase
MTDLFVSYKAEDRARIAPLVRALEAEGLSVWWDQHIGAGSDWRSEIESRLEAARCVLVAWSERATGPEGRFVRDEAAAAQETGRYVPVTIDRVRPPLGFREVQAIDLVGWKGQRDDPRFQALLAAIRSKLSGEAPTAVTPHGAIEQPKISRRGVLAGGTAVTLGAGAGAYLLLRPSPVHAGRIAVLPFANLSQDRRDYFADGLTEELRGALSRAGLQVIGRTSSEAISTEDTGSIVRHLRVSHILTGSVRRSDRAMRVSAQLIAGKDGVETWAENYDREAGDTIRIQSDIAERVASALSVALGTIRKAIEIGGTRDPVAQDYVLQGAQLMRDQGLTREVLLRVVELNKRAIARDPNYARAVITLGQLQASYAGQFASSPEESTRWLADAEKTIRHGVALAPGFGPGYAALADLDRGRLRYRPALAGFRKAVLLAPSNPNTLTRALNALPWIGSLAEAEEVARRLVSLDPLSPTAHSLLTLALSLSGRLDEAVAAGRRAVELSPTNANAITQLAYVHVSRNELDEALRVSGMLSAGDFNRPFVAGVVAARRAQARGVDDSIAALRGLFGDFASYQFAQVHAMFGAVDQAFKELAVAEKVRDPGLMSTMRDPFLKVLRGDARFAALIGRLDFPVVDAGIGRSQ